jgi:uncharacterized membrane protein
VGVTNDSSKVMVTESRAAIRGHPVHPMVVPFPIALLSSAFVADLAFWATRRPFWAQASSWLTRAGAATGVLAAVAGATDFLSIRKAREHQAGRIHAVGNGLALLLATWSAVMRSRSATKAVLPRGLIVSGLIAAILSVTGWFGGELSYRHGIGVSGHHDGE